MTHAAATPAPGSAAGPARRAKGITFQPDIYPKVLSLMPADREARILDVGAGEGYFCQELVERGYRRVEACDYLESLFAVPGVPFHKADLNESIPLAEGTFDAVVSIEVAEHVENHARYFRELVRVCKPGGLVIVTTPNVLSLPSRWHYFLYGYTDCAPRPLDPTLAEYWMQHINPISLPEIMFHLERCGAELIGLETNRHRRSAWVPYVLLYPVLAAAIRGKLLRREYARLEPLYRRHIRWVTSRANLTGRITIAIAQKRPAAG